ncbi:prolylcarboxypeptidase [Thecamonas trahens ATCC 50062]|uniref:Prolylcarboxypeptidase n=1 Tax=Thecamonas trahens ATCC 50062 TaxID=461836 RepID=A0A0L0D1H7_THETB|nr:prolylcarboxypeptidase [Thecamonas trahens ATCC 50062]KNC46087.1 prolylcarboxypeptidase [Thecamonas trahens ATCC 50062]|eukprot:XP_013763067.1 prolylcarboxypeptidase [Thecamonas trahens ATCC 50062]
MKTGSATLVALLAMAVLATVAHGSLVSVARAVKAKAAAAGLGDGPRRRRATPNAGTYAQRYYVNDTFFDGTGPVFLCMGGETPLYDAVAITGSYHCGFMVEVLARNHSALILALEHRFYGASMPRPDLSVDSLKLLTTPQALADMASFVKYASTKFGLTSANKWVTFGGSYPGMMAAWSRLFYPELIHASVASSAPVQAQVEFTGYLDVVAASMAAPIVGGSAECVDVLKAGYAAVGEMLAGSAAQRAQLASEFGVCSGAASSLDDKANWVVFTESLGGLLPVQENDPACTTPVCDIASVCSTALQVVKSGGKPYDAIASINAIANAGQCLNVSYTGEMAALMDTHPDPNSVNAIMRSWTWQTCTEYGYYQVCNPDSDCISVSSPHLNDIESYLVQCKQAFGVSPAETYAAANASNARTGGWNPHSSNILWVNGAIDPWHALSINKPVNGMPAIYVPGASHHFWTHPPLPTDQQPIVAARLAIAAQLQQWL